MVNYLTVVSTEGSPAGTGVTNLENLAYKTKLGIRQTFSLNHAPTDWTVPGVMETGVNSGM